MSPIFTLASIAAHVLAIGALVIAQLLASEPLPFLRRPLTLEEASVVRATVIPSPPARRATSAPAAPHAAPSQAPQGIMAETGRENSVSTGPTSLGDVAGIEDGTGLVDSIGTIVAPAPPANAPASQPPIRLHSGVQPPRKIADVQPVYPPIARSARVEGIVVLQAVVDARGNVESVKVIQSIALLDQAAVEAVRRWKFTPALLNGEPVAVVITVTVNFLLN